MTEQVKNYDAVAAEAEGRAFRFTFAGREWTVRHARSLPFTTLRANAFVSDIDAIDKAFRWGMGEEQFAAFEQAGPSARVIGEMFRDYMDHAGLSSGKSGSSTSSSKSTATPSKRASKPRTRSTSATSSPARSRPAASSS